MIHELRNGQDAVREKIQTRGHVELPGPRSVRAEPQEYRAVRRKGDHVVAVCIGDPQDIAGGGPDPCGLISRSICRA